LALDSDSNQESEPRSKNFTMSHVFCCSMRECESRLETLSEKWHNVTRNTPHDMSLHRSNHGESEVKFRATQARYCLRHFETAKKHVLQTFCGPMSECASPGWMHSVGTVQEWELMAIISNPFQDSLIELRCHRS
jgi:hypothetical protein